MSGIKKSMLGSRVSVLSVAAIVMGAAAIIRVASDGSQNSESLTLLKYAFIPVLCFALIGAESLFTSENGRFSVYGVARFVSAVFVVSISVTFLRWVPEVSLSELKESFGKVFVIITALMLLLFSVEYLITRKRA